MTLLLKGFSDSVKSIGEYVSFICLSRPGVVTRLDMMPFRAVKDLLSNRVDVFVLDRPSVTCLAAELEKMADIKGLGKVTVFAVVSEETVSIR